MRAFLIACAHFGGRNSFCSHTFHCWLSLDNPATLALAFVPGHDHGSDRASEMSKYEFTLKFRLPEASADPGQFIDALAEAGCDDASVGIGQQGRIALDFTREAANALDAITSAIEAVKAAIPGAELIEASPDFVGLTDVADLVGCTRQNMRKLMVNNLATFPVPVHEGSQAIWHLRPVLAWLSETQKRSIDRSLIEISEVTMKVNIAKEARRVPGATLPRELEVLFA